MPVSEEQFTVWRKRLRQTVKESRYTHCLAVQEEAARLAQTWGLDVEKARIAGLLHDVARDLPFGELHQRAQAAGLRISLAEEANPIILHAPVGALILAEDWGITDADILRAVHYHTVAAPAMDDFCRIIFLADLIEPNRRKWPDLENIRTLTYTDLDRAMVAALISNFRYLRRTGHFIHPQAYKAYEYYQTKVADRQE